MCSDEKKITYKWHKDADKIMSNKSIRLMTKDELLSWNGIKIPNRISEDDVLILHPFSAREYISIENAPELGKAKFFAYTKIFQQLGACSYKILQGIEESTERETKIKTKAKVKTHKLKCNIFHKNSFKSKMGFDLSGELSGVPTISEDSYVKAKELISQHCLESDMEINTLVEKRNPQNENRQKKEHIKCSLFEESTKTLDVAASVSSTGIFSVSTSINNMLKTRRRVVLEIDVIFPDSDSRTSNKRD